MTHTWEHVPASRTPGGGPCCNSIRGPAPYSPAAAQPFTHPGPACHSPRPLLEASWPWSWAAGTLRGPPFPWTLSATSPCDLSSSSAVIAPEPCPAPPKAHGIPRRTRRRPADRQPRREDVGLLEGLSPAEHASVLFIKPQRTWLCGLRGRDEGVPE